jgi:signal transduction histidine kinase
MNKNGELIPVSLSVSPIRDDTGRIIGAAKIARDITEQKKSRAELHRLYREAREATRMREEFIAVAGHELRTPLTALQLQLHTAQRRLEAGQAEKAAEGLQRAMGQFQRVAGWSSISRRWISPESPRRSRSGTGKAPREPALSSGSKRRNP